MAKFFYGVKSPKFLIFLVVFINFLGYGIVFPLLPLLTLDYGGNPLISGVMIGIFSLMQDEQGGDMGMLQSFGSVGRIFGPVVAGYIYQTIGPFSPALMATLLTVIILVWGVRSLN